MSIDIETVHGHVRLVKNGDIHGLNNPVAQPDYRRKRINVLLARPTISVSIGRRAAALLAQLDRMADALKESR
ncbi:hypothetical protein [Paraburkholderia sediminicola]|uniref:hypothetical protein n=1 Tax=Paraburkholderia sediminicola TaxID=458836 RepID=UPI0038B76B4E